MQDRCNASPVLARRVTGAHRVVVEGELQELAEGEGPGGGGHGDGRRQGFLAHRARRPHLNRLRCGLSFLGLRCFKRAGTRKRVHSQTSTTTATSANRV